MNKKRFQWQDRVGNYLQLGGIETSTIDDGRGRGCRIAWVNTGTGLRYKVVIDRCLDIADAFYNQYSLAWLSHGGITAARPDANQGFEWLYTFGGGLLTTCGLTHVGGPESDETEQRGIHGRISNIPAQIESIIQPDIKSGKLQMSITAVMKESKVFGPSLELRRTITSSLGCPSIKITDKITNFGNKATPHMFLYHCNFGWPLADQGADIVWRGNWQSAGREQDNMIFSSKNDFRKCGKPLQNHCGNGEAVAFIDIEPDRRGFCSAGLYNSKLNLAVSLKFKKKQLPWLTNWQHWARENM